MASMFLRITCLFTLLVHVHLNVHEEENGEEDYTSDILNPMRYNVTNAFGVINMSDFRANASGFYLFVIHAPQDARAIHLLFRQDSEQVFDNNGNYLHAVIYDGNPEQNYSELFEWNSEENNFLAAVNGSQAWLAITFSEDYSDTSSSRDEGRFDWSIAYVVQFGDNVSECNVSLIPSPENGAVAESNYSFGSVVNLQCSEGYVLEDGPVYVVCSVMKDALGWIRTGAVCSSVCNHPPLVKHAIAQIQINFSINENRSSITNTPAVTMATGTAEASTTALYVCVELYIINGSQSIQCGNGSTGAPQWYDTPPTCIIPECDGISILTQNTGEIVSNVSYSSLVCQWTIQGPSDSNILLNVTLVNDKSGLPDVELWISDSRAPSPRLIPELSKKLDNQSWIINSSMVQLIYRRPSENATGYTGFHVRHLIISSNSTEGTKATSTKWSTETTKESIESSTSTAEHQTVQSTEGSSQSTVPTTESTQQESTEQTTEPTTESTQQESTEQTTEPTTESTQQESTEQTTEPTTESTQQESTEQTTQPTTESLEPSTEQTTEPTTESLVPSTEQTTEPTKESLEPSTEQTTEPTKESLEPSTEQTTEPTKESLEPSTEQTAEPTTESLEPSTEQSVTISNVTSSSAHGGDESNDDGKIAVGVVVPLVFLVIVLVGVYICYRKKYPVRMIIGREFAKFSNPNYDRRGHLPSLIREDADFYFINRNSAGVSSHDFNPVNAKIIYDNPGFVKDEGDDEEEVERKFLQSKSWLFKKTSEEPEGTIEQVVETTAESSFIVRDLSVETPERDKELRAERTVRNGPNTLELVVEQRPTPKPRHKKKTKGEQEKVSEKGLTNGQHATYLAAARSSAAASKVIGSSLPRNFGRPDLDQTKEKDSCIDNNEPSKYIKTSLQLFYQPTFDQVWAEVKARSRSSSVELTPLNGRARSISVDPSKSARKMSLLDEHALAEGSKSIRVSEVRQKLPDGTQNLTAFIVGVDLRDRDTSFASSVLPDEEVLEQVSEAVKAESESTSSLNHKANFAGDLSEGQETGSADYIHGSVTSINDDILRAKNTKSDQSINEENFASSNNYISTNSSNSYSIGYLNDNDNARHIDNTRPFQLRIDNKPAEEILDTTIKAMPDSGLDSGLSKMINNQMITSETTSGIASKGDKDITLAENLLGFLGTSSKEKSPLPISESSFSGSNTARTILSQSVVSLESKQEALLGNGHSGTDESHKETTQITNEFGDENVQGGVYDLEDINIVLDKNHELSPQSEDRQLDQRFHEGKSFSSTTEWVKSRSETSQSVSSSEDGPTFNISPILLIQNPVHLDRSDQDSNSSSEEVASNNSLVAMSTLTPPDHHGDASKPETLENISDANIELFSDGSSDSSDIVSKKDDSLLSRQPPISAHVTLNEEIPAPISLQETSDSSSLDDVDAGQVDVAQSLTWGENKLTYRLRDHYSEDDDIDV